MLPCSAGFYASAFLHFSHTGIPNDPKTDKIVIRRSAFCDQGSQPFARNISIGNTEISP
jgi:hypothetical protein